MLDIFNNNTYTDFRTTNKHVLIPSCYLSDLTEPKCHKIKLYYVLKKISQLKWVYSFSFFNTIVLNMTPSNESLLLSNVIITNLEEVLAQD